MHTVFDSLDWLLIVDIILSASALDKWAGSAIW